MTCSNLMIETLEKCMKYVQSQQQKHQNHVNDLIPVFIVSFEHIHTFFKCFYF